MATNAGHEYANAMQQYQDAGSDEERLIALKLMYQKAPKHKSSEKLVGDLKNKISKLKAKLVKTKKQAKGSKGISIKKEGVATVSLVGTTNTGKSTLLKELTGAKVGIASYEYTTKKPEIGIFDYHGLKLQIVEIPSLFENFENSGRGPAYMALIRQSNLLILFFNKAKEKTLLDKELTDINLPILIYNKQKKPRR